MSKATAVKRFDDIETDSDFDVEENAGAQSVPTLSFKTEATLKASKTAHSDTDSNDSSIVFGLESNATSDHHAAPPAAPRKNVATVSVPPTSAAPPPTAPTKQLASAAAAPLERHSPAEKVPFVVKRMNAPPEAADAPDSDGAHSNIVAEEVLPTQKTVREPARQSAKVTERKPEPAATNENDLLLRAKLRLEEKRRSDNTVNTSVGYSPRVSTSTPLRFTASSTTTPLRHLSAEPLRSPQQPQAYPIASLPPRGGEGTIKRVESENYRLQEEIQFLRQENQKLRAATSTADNTENMRIQLTVDMLRQQVLERERELQRERVERQAEAEELRRQVGEHVDQSESYAASSAQYKSLYESKTRELEGYKKQLQSLLQDVHTIEQRQRALEAKHRDQLVAEQEKCNRTVALLEESKVQRDHLQQLSDQLQKEAMDLGEERRQLREEVQNAKEYQLKLEAAHRRAMETLHSDVAKLQQQVTEKERVYAAQLRDQQRVQDGLQKRLDDQSRESERELAHLRTLMDKSREESGKVVDTEKRLRLLAEDKLREALSDFKLEVRQQQEVLQDEHEKRMKKARDELRRERAAKEELAVHVESTSEELRQCADSLSYYQSECQSLSAAITESEALRQAAEAKCAELSSALEELMLHDDRNNAANRELQLALRAAQEELATIRLRCGSTDSVIADMQRLTNENERLTNECIRLKEARESLTEENGLIANELLRWKNEMRDLLSAQMSASSAPRLPRK